MLCCSLGLSGASLEILSDLSGALWALWGSLWGSLWGPLELSGALWGSLGSSGALGLSGNL
eukprot:9173094-Karenia_brevis.AAC.1